MSDHVTLGEEVRKSQRDLVLIGIRCQGDLDGIEAAQQIPARFGMPTTFLIAFSGDDVLRRAKTADMARFLHKAFSKYPLQGAVVHA